MLVEEKEAPCTRSVPSKEISLSNSRTGRKANRGVRQVVNLVQTKEAPLIKAVLNSSHRSFDPLLFAICTPLPAHPS
jgi:hypothetical protein